MVTLRHLPKRKISGIIEVTRPILRRCGMRLRRLICSGATAVGLTLTGCGGSQPSTKIVSAAAPSILTQPANQTVAVGQTATFTVTATGTTPLSYQWQKGATAISGATSDSYTTPVTTSADSGSQFSVVVTNAI